MHPYKTLLSLDSITKFLTQGERIIAIKRTLDQPLQTTDKMQKALEVIDHFQWQPPETVIKQDRLTYFYNKDTEDWQQIEKYTHPIINEIQKLK